jgi:hypothetical protein
VGVTISLRLESLTIAIKEETREVNCWKYTKVRTKKKKSNTTTTTGEEQKKNVKINNTQEKHCTEEVQQECI